MGVLDIVLRPSVLAFVALVAVYAAYSRYQAQKVIPIGIPQVNKDERIKKTKTTPELFKALKEHFSDKGLRYIYTAPGSDPLTVLPPSEMPWIISQPDSVLSAQEMHREQLQSDWVFLNQNIVQTPLHEHVIRANMVRSLNDFTDPVMDELRQCCEDYWGSSTEWKEVNIWESMLKFFSRTSNRMFVGLPLCRDETFLDACRGYASNIIVSGIFLKMMPQWFKPVLGYAAIAPTWWHFRKASRYLYPLVEKRLKIVEENPEKDPKDLLPNDFVTWSIIMAQKSPDPKERTPELIAKRTMTTNFAAIHTTTMTSTNLLIDILSSNPDDGVVEALREEVDGIDERNSGDWSKASLAAMTRTDSALRESMRLSGFVVWGVARKVIAPKGVDLPDGTHLPYWADVGVPAYAMHQDSETYEDPFSYDAFRFSRQREALDGSNASVHVGEEGLVKGEQGHVEQEKDLRKVLQGKNLSSVTTGADFMQFGHGKLSCPGRFFAVQEIKLLMAYMLQNYEIQYMPSKPEMKWIGTFSMPNMTSSIKIRKRVRTADV